MDESVLFEVNEGIGTIRLNRPNALNALNLEMRERLEDILREVDEGDEVRVLVILGNGTSFCAGQDLKETSGSRSAVHHLTSKWKGDFQTRLDGLNIPVIVGLQGHVIGRGLEVALTCDIRIGAEDTKFSLPEVKIGMLPSSGGTQRLTRLVGESRALHMILTGERLDATVALEWGIITHLVPNERLEATVMGMARAMADSAPLALAYAKRMIRQCQDVPLSEGLRNEAVFSALLLTTEDRQEGINAFREKRKARFMGK